MRHHITNQLAHPHFFFFLLTIHKQNTKRTCGTQIKQSRNVHCISYMFCFVFFDTCCLPHLFRLNHQLKVGLLFLSFQFLYRMKKIDTKSTISAFRHGDAIVLLRFCMVRGSSGSARRFLALTMASFGSTGCDFDLVRNFLLAGFRAPMLDKHRISSSTQHNP